MKRSRVASGLLLLGLAALAWVSASVLPLPVDQVIAAQQQESSASTRLPAIVLISVDTLRADHVGCYGSNGVATPHIDRFARGGTLFSQTNSQVPLTLPSHVSMLTSTYPFANGIEDNGEHLGPNAITLADVLKANGYRTAAFVGGFVLDRRFGLDRGFELYDSPFQSIQKAGVDPGEVKRFGQEVTGAAARWLERNSDHPFFLFVHLYDLHTPYVLPPSERGRGSGYDAELGYLDEALGEFWNKLEKSGLADRALVVFTSDHGESLGEHGEGTHGYFIYQSTLRVPLIIHWPEGSRPAPPRIDEPVSLLDVAPTVLQFVGIAPPREFQGRSLMSLIYPTRTPNEPAGEEEIYSESLYAQRHFGTSALRSLRIGRYKYVEAPQQEFYDLSRDPKEKNNLFPNRKSTAFSFRERLHALESRSRSGHPKDSVPGALSPDTVEHLRALGYVVGAGPGSRPESGSDPKDRIGDYEEYGRALNLAGSGDLTGANAKLQQLLEKDPALLDARLSLGLNQQKLGLHTEAAENFRMVLKQDSLNAVAHFNLGVSEHALGQADAAVKELDATLALAPYYVRAEELLATIWIEKKDYKRARASLNHVLTIDPDNYAAHYNLGALDILDDEQLDGERHLRAAIKADPRSAEAHNALGSLYLRGGNLEQASQEFREAVRLDTRLASAHYNLGIIYRQQQKVDEAAREFQQALTADPQFKPAREALERLGSAPIQRP
jgi:arylsulfatase A-like enzyme/Tfp pilus assembly protein PilF